MTDEPDAPNPGVLPDPAHLRPGWLTAALASGPPRTRLALDLGIALLKRSGSESPRLDAELLLARAVGVDRTAIAAHPDAPIGADALAAYEADLARRAAGEPVAYIRGVKEFYGIAFTVDPRALIPRPETERIVDLALQEIVARLTAAPRPAGAAPLRVVDVGSGAGTIAVSLAVLLRRRRMIDQVQIVGTDSSADALQLATENAVGHGVADTVAFVKADLLPVNGQSQAWDIVLANLPYVPTPDIDQLPVAASFEPRLALDGGADGLDLVRRLLARLGDPDGLAPDGVALLEIGSDQADAIRDAVAALHGEWQVDIEPDLAGLARVARATRA